ncbi:hypothetical protein AB0J82_21185 [Asanoa sp. NPDC049518]|uniref:hypothetical protein n=1 Tax=unclassified Asanoa TaxID=2685164 RepID=UPI00341416E2
MGIPAVGAGMVGSPPPRPASPPPPPVGTPKPPPADTEPPSLPRATADPAASDDLRLDRTPAPPPPPPLDGLRAGPHSSRQRAEAGVVNAVLEVAAENAVRVADRSSAGNDDDVLPTETAVVPSTDPSVPGTGGGGDGGTDPGATGMAVGSVLLIGVGLMAAGVALVGLRSRRDTADHSH